MAYGKSILLIFAIKLALSASSFVKDIPICGEGFRGLLDYRFNRNDDDSLITTSSLLAKNTLNLFTGNVLYRRINLSDCLSPLETFNNKCFAIRSLNDLPTILCASNTLERNEWINAIDSSMMCELTEIKSRLPLISGEETLEDLDEEEPRGLNLFIHDGPDGRPEIYINGKTTKELQEKEEEDSIKKTSPDPLQDLNNLFLNSTAPLTAPADHPVAIGEDEARVEAGLSAQIPTHGYYHYQHLTS